MMVVVVVVVVVFKEFSEGQLRRPEWHRLAWHGCWELREVGKQRRVGRPVQLPWDAAKREDASVVFVHTLVAVLLPAPNG